MIFAFQLTLSIAFWAVLINTIFGIIISLLLTRYTFPGRRALSALIDLPLSVSPIVVGLALLLVYSGRTGWLGESLESAGFQIIYAPPGMIMATAFVSLPLVIRELVPVLTEIGTDAEQAARSLGASPLQSFLRITLPAIKWALLYGVVLSLARSLGEFGAVKIVSGGVAMRTQSATLLVEERYQQFGPENTITAYTAAFILALIAVIALVVVTSLRPKEDSPMSSNKINVRRRQALRRLRRAVRHRPGDPVRSADRAARPQRRWQVDAAADHRGSRAVRHRHGRDRGHRRDRGCRPRSATSASCSSTTRPSGT